MPELKDQAELDAYYMADPIHPRAAGVLWPLIVERRVDNLFDMALRPDAKVRNELFRPSGALGNYGIKVQLAYLLGWMGGDIFKDLLTISKIRNRFAHNLEAKDFSDQKIAAWLNNLRGSALVPEMLEHARAEADNTDTMKTAKILILEGMVEIPQRRFRFCIDLVVHALDDYAKHMKRNLENLPGSWLIGEEKPESFRTQSSDEKS